MKSKTNHDNCFECNECKADKCIECKKCSNIGHIEIDIEYYEDDFDIQVSYDD